MSTLTHTAKYNALGYEEHLYSWESLRLVSMDENGVCSVRLRALGAEGDTNIYTV